MICFKYVACISYKMPISKFDINISIILRILAFTDICIHFDENKCFLSLVSFHDLSCQCCTIFKISKSTPLVTILVYFHLFCSDSPEYLQFTARVTQSSRKQLHRRICQATHAEIQRSEAARSKN